MGGEPIAYDDAVSRAYEPFPIGGAWGPAWDTTWFRVRATVPDHWAGHEVALRFEIADAGDTGFGAEALVWRDGRRMQGLSPNHRECRGVPGECWNERGGAPLAGGLGHGPPVGENQRRSAPFAAGALAQLVPGPALRTTDCLRHRWNVSMTGRNSRAVTIPGQCRHGIEG